MSTKDLPKDFGIQNFQFILGYLGKNPEVKVNKKGMTCVYMDVCQNMQWHTVVFFEPLANYVIHKFRKGEPIMVVGIQRSYRRMSRKTGMVTIHNQLHALQVGIPIIHRTTDRLPPLVDPSVDDLMETIDDI